MRSRKCDAASSRCPSTEQLRKRSRQKPGAFAGRPGDIGARPEQEMCLPGHRRIFSGPIPLCEGDSAGHNISQPSLSPALPGRCPLRRPPSSAPCRAVSSHLSARGAAPPSFFVCARACRRLAARLPVGAPPGRVPPLWALGARSRLDSRPGATGRGEGGQVLGRRRRGPSHSRAVKLVSPRSGWSSVMETCREREGGAGGALPERPKSGVVLFVSAGS